MSDKKTPMKIVMRNIEELIGAEYNPRSLSDEQFASISDSIKRFGLVDPVLVNKNKDRKDIIIGGHQRTKVAKSLGFTEVPTVELDLPLDQEKELNIRLNKNTGSFDHGLLEEFFNPDDLMDWGFEKHEIDFFELDDLEEVDMPDLGDGSDSMIQTMTFTVSLDQNEIIIDALSKAGDELDCLDSINENSNGNKLVAICRKFLHN